MSGENVELVRRLTTLWNRASAGEAEASERSVAQRELADLAGEFFDPDIEWHDQRELPGATVHHGIEEVGRHLDSAQEALDYQHTELLELLDAEPRVLAAHRTHARGRASGAPVERDNFFVYTFRGARIASVEIFGSRNEALEAAGLSK
jgi:ketosteroid isomerase-like protein